MKTFRVPTQEQAGALIAMIAVLFGAWIRLLIPWMAGFPVNDGGLFYIMLRGLQENGLRIPGYVQYNGMSIPFAYPPLGFYAGALSALVFKIDLLQVLQWLPAIVLVATLPAFYLLAKSILGTSFRAGIATLVYAFTPRAITWQVMGGGLTRSFGQLFLILALAFIYRTFTKYSRRDLILAILCSALVVLSHPEAALQTVGLAVVLWLFVGRNRTASLHVLEIGAGTLLLSAVWWLPAVLRYGVGTLLSAAQTGQFNALLLFEPFLMNFVDEPLMSIIAVLAVIGAGYELSQRRGMLPVLLFVPFLVEPRSAPTVAMVPLALLAALALTEIVSPALAGVAGAQRASVNLMRCGPVVLFLVFIGLYMLGDASYFGTQLAKSVLGESNRAAFAWIRENTPPDASFLILTGREELFCDSAQEWFPALTGRVSIATLQGREWTQGAEFGKVIEAFQATQRCAQDASPLSCISQKPLQYNYVLVNASRPIMQNCRQLAISSDGQRLIDELKVSPLFSAVYETEGVALFQKR